jgi:hypothetical protein
MKKGPDAIEPEPRLEERSATSRSTSRRSSATSLCTGFLQPAREARLDEVAFLAEIFQDA